ncbi:MAG: putative toxin-antitoxin system toxin component, PIN family [Deltaproteobacteria bacterium HGW-Deltaproteobacteria-15]|nr:MAG: putative toxin-antitoxin system toxin component, PIN family [Deltaproteobacteria bacterium HGW-Deltaproteobacteria-15]
MKVVIDTNVFISGVFFTGPPSKVLEAWRDQRVTVVISPDIFEEYRRVCDVLTAQFPSIDIEQILELLANNSEIVSPEDLPIPVCEDPDDDKFLSCALKGGASVIISGDKHLLKVSGYKGLQIISPRKFVDDYL